ncbi:conserved hypothetical protein [[Clostridium] ultunense Esp]|nr:conserved hypothetical protein [[Clostridium] ultunense Esp]
MWSKEELLRKTKEQVKEKRFNHILGVVKTAADLAERFGADPEKAEIAAILHDYCKEWPVERLRNLLIKHEDLLWLRFSPVLWHAPAAAYVAREEFQIGDQEIFDAIYYHTTGRAGMSLLDEVIWLADYVEPGRDFEGVEEARRLTVKSLAEGMRFGLKHSIAYLLKKEEAIYPLTFEAYNHYMLYRKDMS